MPRELDTPEESRAAHLPYPRVTLREPREPLSQMLPAGTSVGNEPLVLDNVEHCQRHRARHRVPTKRVEILPIPRKPLEQVGPSRQRGDRMSISHRFPHGDEIRSHAMPLESPHVLPGAPKPGLYLIRDEKPTGSADCSNRRREEPWRISSNTVTGENVIHEQGRRSNAGRSHSLDALPDPLTKLRGPIGAQRRSDRV